MKECWSNGDQRLETGDLRLETRDQRLETGDWRLETGDWRLETGDLSVPKEKVEESAGYLENQDDPPSSMSVNPRILRPRGLVPWGAKS